MKKIETIWHFLLYIALAQKVFKHTQEEIACSFGFSLSTVYHALKIPSQIGAIRKESKFFVLADVFKLLYYWASVRNLERNIIYKTYYEAPINQLEGLIPAQSIYAGYTAAKKLLGEPPADYDKVYFYFKESDMDQVKLRFPPQNQTLPNIFVLELNESMRKFGPITTLPHTFVDIWNLKDWYGRDFTQKLEEKIHELLS